jgi:hypothetical protein
MFCVGVRDVAARRERRDSDHRDTRTGSEEINRLDEAGVVKSAPFVGGDEDRRLCPQSLIALSEGDDVLCKCLEKSPL